MNNFLHFKMKTKKNSKILSLFVFCSMIALPAFQINTASATTTTSVSRQIKDLKNTRVTAEIKAQSLEASCRILARETKMEYIFDSSVNISSGEKFSLNVKNMPLLEALDKLLANSAYNYKIENNKIILTTKPVSSQKMQEQKQIELRGKVVNAKGHAIVGATVISASGVGSITDNNGAFVLTLAKPESVEVSYVGYISQESTFSASRSNIIFELAEDVMAVDDVIVNGLYQANKKTYTGAATQITRQDIENIGTSNVFSILQAFDPSFRINENIEMGSDPNNIPDFQVRGASSISMEQEYGDGSNTPLFIVDGFEMTSEKVYDLEPDRIGSVTILKDASATAIYGSKAANGVVVIELVRPEVGKLEVRYSARYVISAPDLTSYNLLDAESKFELETITGTITPFTDEYNNKLMNLLQGYDTYWLDKPIQVGHDLVHNLSISGGDEKLRYSLGASYSPNRGVMIGSDRNTTSLYSTLEYVNKIFRISNTVSYDKTVSNDSPYGSYSTYAQLNPYYRYTDDDGDYLFWLDDGVTNPLWNTLLDSTDSSSYDLFSEQISINANLAKGLTLRATGAVNIKNSSSELFYSAQHTNFANEYDLSTMGSYYKSNTESIDFQSNIALSYSTHFNKNYLTVNTAYNVMTSNATTTSFSAVGFVSDKLNDPIFANQYTPGGSPSGSSSLSRTMGVMGNINYAYDNKYFADVSFRFDASSRFGADSRWAPFYSVGVGYNIHKEEFMKDVTFINLLKLRGSYGVTGSQNYDPYQANTKYEYVTDEYYGSYSIGALMTSIGNSDLEWQQTYSSNIGLDVAMLNNRLSMTFNYYKDRSENLLVPLTLASSLGFTSYTENLGESENNGYEISVRYQLIKKKDFNLYIAANGAHNENKLVKISNALAAWNDEQDAITNSEDNDYENAYSDATEISKVKVRYIEGQSMNTIWVVKSLGIDPANGLEMYLDKDGNITYEWNEDDQVAYATTDAVIDGTLSLNLQYKNLSVNLYGRYSLGGYTYNSTLVSKVENVSYENNCDARVFEDRWQEPGDVVMYKSVYDKTATKPTSRFVQLNNYLSLTSINIRYGIPESLLEKVGVVNAASISFNTDNLLYLSTVKQERGTSYPFARTFNFTLQLSF